MIRTFTSSQATQLSLDEILPIFINNLAAFNDNQVVMANLIEPLNNNADNSNDARDILLAFISYTRANPNIIEADIITQILGIWHNVTNETAEDLLASLIEEEEQPGYDEDIEGHQPSLYDIDIDEDEEVMQHGGQQQQPPLIHRSYDPDDTS